MKKWLKSSICLLLAVMLIVGSAAFVRAENTGAQVDITSGLLAHYDFETVEGTRVSNNVSTNTTTTAEIKNGASVVDSGKLGKAMQITDNTQGMQMTNIVNAAESSFTVSMWYKLSGSSSANVNLFQAGTMGGSTGRTILILKPDSTYRTYLTAQNVDTATSVDRNVCSTSPSPMTGMPTRASSMSTAFWPTQAAPTWVPPHLRAPPI